MLGTGGLTMGARNKGIYRLFRSKEELDSFVGGVIHSTRVYTLDDVTIALGRMGFTVEQFAKFREVYSAVAYEYAVDVKEDAKCDKDLWYSRETKDRELRQYVGELYAPWEERFE